MATRTTRCRRMGTVGDTSHFHKPELAVKCDPRVSWCEGYGLRKVRLTSKHLLLLCTSFTRVAFNKYAWTLEATKWHGYYADVTFPYPQV